jgi:hypothetical protein
VFLGGLQTLVRDFYALELTHDVRDFVTTDADVASRIDREGRPADEKLLIEEHGGEASVCLYLDAELVGRLAHDDPNERLHSANLEDFLTALEGVSHFVYYAWNAALDKSVTLLEMELQAEVDKFVATTLLLQRQGERPPQALHRLLFDLPRLDPRLAEQEVDRYRQANRYAARYCAQLGAGLAQASAAAHVQSELRRFYRLPQAAKIEHIDGRQ